MNKREAIDNIQKELGCETRVEAERAFDAVVATLSKGIKQGAKTVAKPKKGEAAVKAKSVFLIPGLGSFRVAGRPARDGRNPSNGAKVRVKSKKVLSFKPASGFKI